MVDLFTCEQEVTIESLKKWAAQYSDDTPVSFVNADGDYGKLQITEENGEIILIVS